MSEHSRPNILFLMADQFRGDIMSCVGGKANTKNLDMIASEDAGEITNALREKMLKAIMQNQCRIPSVVQQHKAFVN